MGNYFSKRAKSFTYAWQGIKYLFGNESNAKIHLLAAVCVITVSALFKIECWEWCAVIFAIGGVFMAEGFNTAIEKVCDKVSPAKNHLIKITKDVAAGSVLLFVLSAVAVGLIIFLPRIIALFNHAI